MTANDLGAFLPVDDENTKRREHSAWAESTQHLTQTNAGGKPWSTHRDSSVQPDSVTWEYNTPLRRDKPPFPRTFQPVRTLVDAHSTEVQPRREQSTSRAVDKDQLYKQPPPTSLNLSSALLIPCASLLTVSRTVNFLFKVLFIFPSRYLFAIGLVPIFSFRRSLPPLLGCIPKQPDSEKTPRQRATLTHTGFSPSMTHRSKWLC